MTRIELEKVQHELRYFNFKFDEAIRTALKEAQNRLKDEEEWYKLIEYHCNKAEEKYEAGEIDLRQLDDRYLILSDAQASLEKARFEVDRLKETLAYLSDCLIDFDYITKGWLE